MVAEWAVQSAVWSMYRVAREIIYKLLQYAGVILTRSCEVCDYWCPFSKETLFSLLISSALSC